MRKLVFILVLTTALLMGATQAQASVGLTVSSDESCSITPGTYSIGVTNDQKSEDTFRITALGAKRSWIIHDNKRLELDTGESGSFQLQAIAPDNADSGFHRIQLVIFSENNETLREETQVCLIVKRVDELAVSALDFSSGELAPGDTLTITSMIENVGTEPFRNVRIGLEVVGPEEIALEGETITLFRGESRNITREVQITNNLMPGDYLVRTTVEKDGVLLASRENTYRIDTLDLVDKQEDERSGIFTTSGDTTLVNRGNVESTEIVTKEVSSPFTAFVSAPEANVRDIDGGARYQWTVTLAPGESRTVGYTVHKWPFYLIAIIILYGAYQFYIVTKRPTIRKNVLSTKHHQDDIKEFSIGVEVRNTTPHKLENVTVREFVPSVAKVYKDFNIKPHKQNVTQAGTELKWRFKELQPGEERIIRYRIRTTVGTIDQVRLPPGIVEGKQNGKNYRVHSNEVRAGSDRDII